MERLLYSEPFKIEDSDVPYRCIAEDYVEVGDFEGHRILKIHYEGLVFLSETAFTDMAYLLRSSHLKRLQEILSASDSSKNDRYVALELIKNAVIASSRLFPLCQDTGTAIVFGKKGQMVWTGFNDREALSRGIFNAYTKNPLRYSQLIPLSMFDEKNSGNNLPAQIEIEASGGNRYSFLFIAKGGGSSNKTYLFQKSKAILNERALKEFIGEKIKEIGTAACPPYHLVVVVGGTSPEFNLKTVKLASAGYLDSLPEEGGKSLAFRDREFERWLIEKAKDLGIGAQFGGRYFAIETRALRLPRHGASCFVGIGVSCSAHRNILGYISDEGIFLERLEEDPARFLPTASFEDMEGAYEINMDSGMARLREELSKIPVGARLRLKGHMIVARDMAHSKVLNRLKRGESLPSYIYEYPIYYAGPAKTVPGYPSGSFGPTTSARMDPYVPEFQKQGISLVMVGKGNRSSMVKDSCKRYGGFYLGSIGGGAARIGKECIRDMRLLDYEELGMEAIYMIEVEDFPAFLIIDDKGNDFYETVHGGL